MVLLLLIHDFLKEFQVLVHTGFFWGGRGDRSVPGLLGYHSIFLFWPVVRKRGGSAADTLSYSSYTNKEKHCLVPVGSNVS